MKSTSRLTGTQRYLKSPIYIKSFECYDFHYNTVLALFFQVVTSILSLSFPHIFIPISLGVVREVSLTMGARGLQNPWWDHKISEEHFGGSIKFQVPIMGGSQNPLDGEDHKIHLMGGVVVKLIFHKLGIKIFLRLHCLGEN